MSKEMIKEGFVLEETAAKAKSPEKAEDLDGSKGTAKAAGAAIPHEAEAAGEEGQEAAADAGEEEVLEALSITYKVTFDDVMSAFNQVDKAVGNHRRIQVLCNVLMVVAALHIILFFKDFNGVSLVFACIFAMMALFAKKRSLNNNVQLAKSFAEDEGQHLSIGWKEADINGTVVSYREVKKVMEFADSYVIQYQGNRFLPVPKRLLAEEENAELSRRLRGLLEKDYEDHT